MLGTLGAAVLATAPPTAAPAVAGVFGDYLGFYVMYGLVEMTVYSTSKRLQAQIPMMALNPKP